MDSSINSMAINYSQNDDVVVPNNSHVYRGLEGDDIYILTSQITSEKKISIVDTKGLNKIQFVDNFQFKETKFAKNAFQITLDNNSIITINSAENFSYEIGANATTNERGITYSYDELAVILGFENLPQIGAIENQSSYEVIDDELKIKINEFKWNIKKPESVGLESSEVDKIMDYIKTPSLNTQAAILIKGNSIVSEFYADGYDKDDLVTSWSVAKSFSSTIIGIAIDEGYINSVDDSIALYLPKWNKEPQENISLKYLLAMRSGMDDHPGLGVYFQSDMASYSLDRAISREPGILFSYSNEDSMLLGRIIENATGLNFQEYADTRLFDKLNINETWWTDKNGNTLTYAGLDMTPREFAKFGLMIAQEGKWLGEQIVSESWIDEATSEFDNLASYGYQWWTSTISERGLGSARQDDYPFFSALGLDGQYIYVWPEKDLVLVRFTKYQHQGNSDSSVVDIVTGTYHGTESGNMAIYELENLFYAVGDNLEDQIVPTYLDFG